MAERVAVGGRIPALAISALLVVIVSLRAAPARAHALDPVLFELVEQADGLIHVTWKAPNARVPGLNLVPVFPPECRRVEPDDSPAGDAGALSPEVLQIEQSETEEGDTSIRHWKIECAGGLAGRTIGIDGLEITDALVRVQLNSGSVNRRVLGAGHSRITIQEKPTRFDVLADYVRLGVEHIFEGLDHLLFVFGLVLLAANRRALLALITAFTAGHSLTLALAALRIIWVPQAAIEVLIAVTIWILAVELSRNEGRGDTLLRRRPWAMSFTFGLLHGLGFAGALREAGLPVNDVPTALLSFNVGIEAGQLTFVCVVLAAMSALRVTFTTVPGWAVDVPVFGMGMAATYWTLVRASPLF